MKYQKKIEQDKINEILILSVETKNTIIINKKNYFI